MDRSRGLSESERQDLLERIQVLLGDSPKGRLVREIVESLPATDSEPQPDEVPEAD
jgi:hypothetical protein